jgi:hypothetical protein
VDIVAKFFDVLLSVAPASLNPDGTVRGDDQQVNDAE